ncbi:MAG: UDP-N-acetylglucosamine 1-carboxyvinyltransferase [Bacillota bacterium]|nr:UDP-N-acetylglucosamine 1-carboxyvinyltransferase [Bacillota bacterium]
MEKAIIRGGARLRGSVRIGGSKNAVLPVLAASILAESPCVIRDVPHLDDVLTICEVLQSLGAVIKFHPDGAIEVDTSSISVTEAPYALVRRMRASFLVMGPLLARLGHARISLPGGCAIGARPIDLHLKGFEALGARVSLGDGYVKVVSAGLAGDKVYLDFPSVGATENIMMAAALSEGTTFIENAAEEPEIIDLGNFLSNMGAGVRGAGTKVIRVDGRRNLHGVDYTVIPDRIEAGTFMVAGAITRGDVVVENVVPEHLKPVIAKLQEVGAQVIEESETQVRVIGPDRPEATDLKTLPYPGFPTDMQAQMMALMCVAEGTSIVTETVFENRFMHVGEMKRMGADIKIEGRSAVVRGSQNVWGAPVRAPDLRAGAALMLLGLRAQGITEVSGLEHIDRGYADIASKLRALGADVQRVPDLI